MKKVYILLVICLIFFPFSIHAIEGEGESQGNGGYQTVTGDSWPTADSNGHSLRGVRITIYEFDNNTSTAIKSIDFVQNSEFYNYLTTNNLKFYSAKTSRFEYSQNKVNFNLSSGSFDGILEINSTLPMFLETNGPKLYDFFNPKGANYNETKVKQYLSKFNSDKTKSSEKYYYVIEPTLSLKIEGNLFYGTAYEIIYYAQNLSLKNINTLIYKNLPYSFYISSISDPDTANFKGFLSSVQMGNKYANQTKAKRSATEILSYTYGVGLLWDADFYDPTEKTTCTTTFNYSNDMNSNNCGSIGVKEDDRKECILGNSLYYSSNYNEQTSIYCSNETSSLFDNFYSTFEKSIRTGSYFSMNNLLISNKKTCYIKTTDLSNSNGWQNTIKSIENKMSSNISITVGNRKYNLLEKVSYGDISCISVKDSYCEGATLETTYTYSLNPLTNRFINIISMKEDSCTSEDTCKNISTNIDNGGPKLTVPLNYLGGIYKYKLDLSDSIFKTLSKRLKNIDSNIIKIDEIKYDISYDYSINNESSTSISETDLEFYCPYKVTQYQCQDSNGNYYPCDDPSCVGDNCDNVENTCGTLEKDECCINNQKVACPQTCNYECCDSSGNEIACPGSDSILGDLIYRPISLIEPFPGIDGNGRTPGNNWNKIYKASNGKVYSYSDYYVRLRRGYKNYEIYQAEPLYVIKLDGDKIQAIRKYNDKHNYNDFELTCINGENCISKFLRGQTQDFSINLIDSGTCKNINNYNFNSCIKNKGE